MLKMSKSVGLIAAINKDGELQAILQKRPKFNGETNQPESYPGGCQVTCHGRLKEKESNIEALVREAEEELGGNFSQVVIEHRDDLIKVHQKAKGDEEVITYGLLLKDEQDVQKIRPTDHVEKIIFFPLKDIDQIQNLKQFDRRGGVEDGAIVAMFEDEIKALKKLSKKLKK